MNKLLSKFKKSSDSGKLPSKRSMNLYVKVKDGNSWQVIVPLAVFLILVVFAIYRLGVVDRLNKLASIQSENSRLESQLNELNEQLKSYAELEEEYRRYTTSYLREDEYGLLSRSRVFELLDECTDGIATIKNINIESNQVAVVVDIVSLEDIDIIQDRLEAITDVDEIKVSTAKGTNNVDVEGSIVFTVKNGESGSDDAKMSAEERASKTNEFSQAAAAAREAVEAAANSVKSAVQGGGSSGTGSTGSGSGSTSASHNTQPSSGSSGSSALDATTQNINGDEVVILPEGVSIYGFDSLEAGQQKLQGEGAGQ